MKEFVKRRLIILSILLFICAIFFAFQAEAAKVSLNKPSRMIPATAYLIGTYDENGRPDACIIDRAGIAETPAGKMIFYVGIRPSRYTAGNIDKTGAFTVNVPNAALIAQADYCGTVSNKDSSVDKFAATGLNIAKGDDVNAPVLTDCPVVFECKLIKSLEFPDAQHKIFFGEVISYHVKSSALDGDKTKPVLQYDTLKAGSLAYAAGSGERAGHYALSGPVGGRGRAWREKFPWPNSLEPEPRGGNHKPDVKDVNKNGEVKTAEDKIKSEEADEFLRFTGSPHFLPAPVMVVGAYASEDGEDKKIANFAVFHRGGLLASGKDDGPIRVGIGIKDINHSLTYKAVKESGACSVNIPSLKYLAETDLLGNFSGLRPDGKLQDKLKVTGLKAAKSDVVNAPVIQEFPISLECEYEDEFSESPESKGRLIILKVKNVLVDDNYLDGKGKINPINDDKDSSILFFSHSHGKNGGYYALGEFLGKSGVISEQFRKK